MGGPFGFVREFSVFARAAAGLGQLELFCRQGQQMLALDPQSFAHGVRLARNPPLLIGTAGRDEHLVQLFQTPHPRDRHLPKMVKAATSRDLRRAFKDHLKETEEHVSRDTTQLPSHNPGSSSYYSQIANLSPLCCCNLQVLRDFLDRPLPHKTSILNLVK